MKNKAIRIGSTFVLMLIFLLQLSCGGDKQTAQQNTAAQQTTPQYTAPQYYVITSKTIAIASQSRACKDCEENAIQCCVMRYGDKRFVRNQTYVLDSTGHGLKMYDYMAAPELGTMIYESPNIPADYEEYYQVQKQRISWVADKRMLIDNNDTIKDFEILPEHHVIIADGGNYSQKLIAKGNWVVYSYK